MQYGLLMTDAPIAFAHAVWRGVAGQQNVLIAANLPQSVVMQPQHAVFELDFQQQRGVAGVAVTGIEQAARAVVKAQRHHRAVFGLDFVGQQGAVDYALQTPHAAAKPLHQIQGMNGLVDQQAAPLGGETAAPRTRGIVVAGT